ncbi:MAG: DUF2970 domain-containing protein [Burkholderiaceae bacterium]|nr:DUF2970 domain-containing protein [Burkholderiaceae bacterium]
MRAAEMDRARSPHRRKASLAQTAAAVFWSFFGVRKRAHYEADAAQLNPVHVIVMGVVGAAVLVAVLILVVRWVVG